MPETVTISREDAEWLEQYGLWLLIRNLSAAPALADHLATAECVKARLESALSPVTSKEPTRGPE